MHFLSKCARIPKSMFVRCFAMKPDAQSQTSEKSEPSYMHYNGKLPLVYRTLGQELERAAVDYAGVEAIVSCHEGKRRTFNEILDEVNRLAAGFYKIGLNRGDHIAIWGPNNLQWYLTMLAAARAGMTSVGINPVFQAPELEFCLNKVNLNAIVASESYRNQNYYEILASVCPELKDSQPGRIKSKKFPDLKVAIIDTKTRQQGAFTYNECLDMAAKDDIQTINKLQNFISPDSPCNVQFTSGTTGYPKAAMLSHFNFVNNGIHVGVRNELAEQRICVLVPLFHGYGVVITIMAALSHGATLVLPDAGFNPKASLLNIVAEKCSVIHGTPTMFVDLVRRQKEMKLPITSAKMAVTGGAPCSPQLFLDIKKYLGVEQVRSVYGMTETTGVVFQSRSGDNAEEILHTVGHVQDHVEVKVIDTEGNAVPFGKPGELCIRGYLTQLCYYEDEAKTKQIFGNDRWLRTGDQFILQKDGYGRIVGRLKDIIIRGGENIFPKEVEDFLNQHPDIIEAHVIGVPDERLGEELCAFIRQSETAKEPITSNSLKEYGKGKISRFKIPRYVVPVEDFPKTTSGKVQKFKLLEQFKKQVI